MGRDAVRSWMIAALLAAPALAADVRVLTTSGTQIAGFGIAGLDDPVAGTDGAVLFRGVNTKLEVAGHAFTSGDPLPAPSTGTFERILKGVTAGNLGAVLTAANGPTVAWAIFLVEGSTVTPAVTVGPTDGVELRNVTMNARGDIAYHAAIGSNSALYLQPRATGVPVLIAGPNRDLRTLRGFAIDDGGAVAWMDRRGSAWHWDAVHGLRTVGTGRRTTGAQRDAVALHATFGLAFVTRDDVLRWDPQTGDGEVVLQRNQIVDGSKIRRLYGQVGFLADGTLTVRVRATKLSWRYMCENGDTIAGCSTPGVSGAGVPVASQQSSALFRLNGSSITALVRPGDVLTGVGSIADVTGQAADGSAVVFSAVLTDGRDVLGRWRAGNLDTLAVDGQRVGSRTLDLGLTLYDAGNSIAVVDGFVAKGTDEDEVPASGLLLVNRKGRVTTIAPPRRKRQRDLGVEDAVLVGSRLVALTNGPDGLFVVKRGRLAPLLLAGKPRFGSLDSIDAVVASGSHLFFVATRNSGSVALYEMVGRERDRVVDLPSLPVLVSAGGDEVAFTAPVPDLSSSVAGAFVEQLWIVDDGAERPLLGIGDPTPVGDVAAIDGIAIAGRDVVVSASVSGAAARHALLAIQR